MANEKRLIDANDVYSLFGQSGRATLHVADIDVIPRVDAVEVVHAVLVSIQIALESIRQYRRIVGHDSVFDFSQKEINELAYYARYLLGGNMDGGNEDV